MMCSLHAYNCMGLGSKEGRNFLFNDTLNTFYLWLYGVKHMVKDHSDSLRGNPCHHMGYSLRSAARVLLYASSHRHTYHSLCYTSHRELAERDLAQSIACPPLKRSVVGSILLSGPSCSLGYFPFQPVVHNWFIKGHGMYCSVYGKVHIKDPLLLIEKSSLCGGSGFPSKKCVNVTI